MRRTDRRELLQVARRRQRDVLCDVMLSAQECVTWLTLDELAKLTHYPPAGIKSLTSRAKEWQLPFGDRNALVSRLARVRLRSPIYKV